MNIHKLQIFIVFNKIYKRLSKYLKYSFWKIILLAVFTALVELVLAGSVSLLGVALATPQTIITSNIMQEMIQIFPSLNIINQDIRLLLSILIILCILVAIKSIFLFILTWRQSVFSHTASMQIGVKLYTGYINAPYLWHINQKTSELIAVIEWRYNLGLFLFNTLQVVSQSIVILILLICVCIVAPISSIIVMSIAVLCTLYILKCSKKFIKDYSQKCVDAKHESYKMIYCGLSCIRDIIIYQQQKKFIQNFTKYEKKYSINQSKLPIFPPLPSWILEFIGMFILFITTLLLYLKNDSITYISATLALFAAAAWRLLPVVNRIVQSIITMQQQVPALKNIINMMSQIEHIGNTLSDTDTIYPFNRELRLEHIYFRYHSPLSKHEILRDINISIYKGNIIGIIGLSGAGKSTLVNTIIGLYPPSKGKIIVDDQEINDTNRAAWMRSIGYIPQNPIMLNASLAENIAFSHWGETIDRERVIKCCKLAAIDFLDDLEFGIDTILGERSARLSGGQLQRVAIARALYINPQIIIFDEATSALDNTHEYLIYNFIYSLKEKITIIIISHKLSTLEKCDYIYRIGNGCIIEEGKPEKIITK